MSFSREPARVMTVTRDTEGNIIHLDDHRAALEEKEVVIERREIALRYLDGTPTFSRRRPAYFAAAFCLGFATAAAIYWII